MAIVTESVTFLVYRTSEFMMKECIIFKLPRERKGGSFGNEDFCTYHYWSPAKEDVEEITLDKHADDVCVLFNIIHPSGPCPDYRLEITFCVVVNEEIEWK